MGLPGNSPEGVFHLLKLFHYVSITLTIKVKHLAVASLILKDLVLVTSPSAITLPCVHFALATLAFLFFRNMAVSFLPASEPFYLPFTLPRFSPRSSHGSSLASSRTRSTCHYTRDTPLAQLS